MNNEKFEKEVDAFFGKNPCEDAVSGRKALLLLYGLMVEFAQSESDENWFKVQQLQTWTPLRFFWETLAADELLPIRAAAKGNLCEAKGTYWGDPEVTRMSMANFKVMQKEFRSADPLRLQRELAEHPRANEAEQLWVIAGFGRFTPQLIVKDLGEA